MKITLNTNLEPATGVTSSQSRVRPPQTGSDTASFKRVEALNEALRATPLVRPGRVAQAQQLMGDVQYPPAEIIQGLASLFAMNLDDLSPDQS